MKKELRDQIKKYSSAATAVVATSVAANAQIVYNQVNKTIAPAGGIPAAADSIDLNTDGTFDIIMGVLNYPSYSFGVVFGGPLNYQGHAMAGSAPSGYNYPFKLNSGNPIKTQQFLPAESIGTFAFMTGGSFPYNEKWNGGVTDGYLGLKLQIGGNTHYGWVRMDVGATANQVVIKDMAYHSTADAALNAGEGGLNLEKFEGIVNSAWINKDQLHTDIQIGFTSGSVALMDMSGKAVKSFDLTEAKSTFDLSDLPKGTYILSLNLDGNVYNKQAVVH